MKNSYALITGATSGIGLEISKDLARRGFNLILVARTIEKLVQTSNDLSQEFNIKCDYFSSDLTLIDSPDEIYDQVVTINNQSQQCRICIAKCFS